MGMTETRTTAKSGKGFIYFGAVFAVLALVTTIGAYQAGNTISAASGFLFVLAAVLLIIGFAKRR